MEYALLARELACEAGVKERAGVMGRNPISEALIGVGLRMDTAGFPKIDWHDCLCQHWIEKNESVKKQVEILPRLS
jgi:hypothetical protein